MSVSQLAQEIGRRLTTTTGVTFSGGEPFEQAGFLADVVDRVRTSHPDLSVMSYSGNTWEELIAADSPDIQRYLAQLDILVDGVFDLSLRRTDLLWRGSSNQKVHYLSDRHAIQPDRSAGVEVQLKNKQIFWVGIPPSQRFRAELRRNLERRGMLMREEEGGYR
jgi:anaerobic ribonucleoside-triphosphate reductase activating protein